ncbi:MAG: tetratricopeptide repeat protein [Myxococcaceae bacterium]
MARKRSGQGWTEIEAAAEAALSGRGVDAHALIRLVHDVNPTGRGLPPQAERQRYQLKARLQSLLVARIRGELAVERVAGEPGAITLRHRPSGENACHAVIEELDEEARSIVRFILDQGEEGDAPASAAQPGEGKRPNPPGPPAYQGDPLTLVAEGRRAQEAYDFDLARSCFEEAFDGSGGSADTARPLLEFLVDQLAGDEAALAFEAALDEDAAEHPEVRALLALAAARSGDAARARRHLQGAEVPRASEAAVALARCVLATGAADEAERLLQEARRLDPAQPEAVPLEGEIARARAASSRPLEEQLEAVLRQGDDAGSERLARQVLECWPQSALGRKVLREVADRRRAADARAREVEGAAALEAGDFALAEQRFREASALGGLNLAPKILLAERSAAEQRAKEALGVVEQAIARGDLEAALGAYLGLEPGLKGTARGRFGRPEFEWLEQLGPLKGASQQRAAVEAVVALGEVERQVPWVPEELLRALSPHDDLLGRVPRAKQLLAEAKAALEARERRDAEALLGQARALMAAGNVEGAARLAGSVPLQPLPEEARAQARELAALASARLGADQRRRELDELLARGALFDALDLATGSGPGAGEVLREVRRRLRQELRLRVAPAGSVRNVDVLAEHRFLDDGGCWLDAAGERLYVGTAHGRWVFLRVLRADTGRVETLVSLRAPEPLDFVTTSVGSDTVRLVGESGSLLELALGSFDVTRWRPATALRAADEVTEQALTVAGSRFLWVEVSGKQRMAKSRTQVMDLDRRRVHRNLESLVNVSLVQGGSEPRVLGSGLDREGRLFALNGTQLAAFSGATVERAAGLPDGEGLVGLVQRGSDEYPDAGPLALAFISSDGKCGEPRVIEGSWSELEHLILTSSESGLVYAVFVDDDRRHQLAAFRPGATGFEPIFQGPLPQGALLVQDLWARRVAVLAPVTDGHQLCPLGAAMPGFRESPAPLRQGALLADVSRLRCAPYEHSGEAQRAAQSANEETSKVARARAVASFRERHRDDAGALLDFGDWLGLRAESREESEAVHRFAWDRHSGHPRVEVHRAEKELGLGKGEEALARLLPLDPAGLPTGEARHLLHLRGLAHFEANRLEEALADFQSGIALAGDGCDLKDMVELVCSLQSPDAVPGEGRRSAIRELVRVIWLADQRLDAGEAGGARAALDCWAVWSAREAQSMARLAEATLADEPARADEKLRKALVLSAYVELRAETRERSDGISLAAMAWPPARLDEVARRASEWLEREG